MGMTKNEAPKLSPAAAAIDAQLKVGAVLVDVKYPHIGNSLVVSLTGKNGSPKSITVREMGEGARDLDLIINRRSLGGYRIA